MCRKEVDSETMFLKKVTLLKTKLILDHCTHYIMYYIMFDSAYFVKSTPLRPSIRYFQYITDMLQTY